MVFKLLIISHFFQGTLLQQLINEQNRLVLSCDCSAFIRVPAFLEQSRVVFQPTQPGKGPTTVQELTTPAHSYRGNSGQSLDHLEHLSPTLSLPVFYSEFLLPRFKTPDWNRVRKMPWSRLFLSRETQFWIEKIDSRIYSPLLYLYLYYGTHSLALNFTPLSSLCFYELAFPY